MGLHGFTISKSMFLLTEASHKVREARCFPLDFFLGFMLKDLPTPSASPRNGPASWNQNRWTSWIWDIKAFIFFALSSLTYILIFPLAFLFLFYFSFIFNTRFFSIFFTSNILFSFKILFFLPVALISLSTLTWFITISLF